MMKKVRAILLLIFTCLGLFGCSMQEASVPAVAETEPASTMDTLLRYIEKNGVYLSAHGKYGIQMDMDDATTSLFSENGKLELVLEMGEPIVDWRYMDLMDFVIYKENKAPSKIPGYYVGDYFFNYLKMTLTMDPITHDALCKLEYIENGKSGLGTGAGAAEFRYDAFDGAAEFVMDTDISSFNTDSKMLSERGTQVLHTGLEFLSRMLKECDGGFSLKDIGWEQIG